MQIKKTAIAGTLESSDAQITIEPSDGGIELSISSIVMGQYGRQIRETVLQTLAHLKVDHCRVTVVDRGALDCTLKARMECAVFRASGNPEEVPWGGLTR